MIWAILALLGVPLWLCAIAILVLIVRNRQLRKLPGSLPVRVRAGGKGRWGLHRLGDVGVVATFELVPKGPLEVAARAEHASLPLGPFAKVVAVPEPGGVVGSRVAATT